MSRLIIKNLPQNADPARLREHFQQAGGPGGTLTDVKVAMKPDGKSRRFGFVGYKTEKEALAAKEWFDRTFIGSTRISVNVIEGAKDAPAPRPNKRIRLDPSVADVQVTNVKMKDTKPQTSTSQLDKFMEVMQPRTKKGPSWANEAPAEQNVPIVVDADEVLMDNTPDTAPTAALSDLEWMKQRMTQTVDETTKVFEQSDDEEKPDERIATSIPENEKVEIDPTKETILRTSRLFVRNLAFSCTDAELQELFQVYGEISQIHIPIDPVAKQAKGLAYVTFAHSANALTAYEALDKKSFQGRLLHILAAVDRKGNPRIEDGDGRKKSVKEEKDAKRKAMAGKDFNWSMLYMNSDAVASSIADRMNINKADILNPESGDNAAVKLALAETHIIHETKTYLESQGVQLSSFSSKARSDTTILVKNIPYGTTVDQITALFEPHGTLSRVLVPPAGTMAVVDFENSVDASKGFRAVSYRRLGNSVIYLEKGPLGVFEGSSQPPAAPTKAIPSRQPIKLPEQEAGSTAAGEEELSVAGGTTLYVKNLAFSTTKERLTNVFQHLPSFSFARIQTKPDPNRPNGPRLSMGYGFVGFKDVDSAKKALKSMQNFELDGHALHVKFAGRNADDDEIKDKDAGKSKSQTTKMIVKNLPFEATKKDVRDLFSSHGHLKSVRLPKKFDSRTRGFAFLEFVSRHEAENAYAALRHTHLLGRHLVLEWAEEAEQDLDKLRQKAGVGFGDGKAMPGKKRKLDLGKDGVGVIDDVEDL